MGNKQHKSKQPDENKVVRGDGLAQNTPTNSLLSATQLAACLEIHASIFNTNSASSEITPKLALARAVLTRLQHDSTALTTDQENVLGTALWRFLELSEHDAQIVLKDFIAAFETVLYCRNDQTLRSIYAGMGGKLATESTVTCFMHAALLLCRIEASVECSDEQVHHDEETVAKIMANSAITYSANKVPDWAAGFMKDTTAVGCVADQTGVLEFENVKGWFDTQAPTIHSPFQNMLDAILSRDTHSQPKLASESRQFTLMKYAVRTIDAELQIPIGVSVVPPSTPSHEASAVGPNSSVSESCNGSTPVTLLTNIAPDTVTTKLHDKDLLNATDHPNVQDTAYVKTQDSTKVKDQDSIKVKDQDSAKVKDQDSTKVKDQDSIKVKDQDSIKGKDQDSRISNVEFQLIPATSSIASFPLLCALSFTESTLRTPWKLLFSSAIQGRSFNKLLSCIDRYPGGTVILVTGPQGRLFGGYCDSMWRESPAYYGPENGSSASFLFRLLPSMQVFRSRGSSEPETRNYQFLNSRRKQIRHGLAMGGSMDQPRFYLDENLEACRATEFGLTFEMGKLRVPRSDRVNTEVLEDEDSFTPEAIEVWGVGSMNALQQQQEALRKEFEIIMARRKVDRKQFANSDFDREFLLGKTFAAVNSKEER